MDISFIITSKFWFIVTSYSNLLNTDVQTRSLTTIMENFLIPLNEALSFGENVYTIYHIRFAFLQNFES